MKKLLIILCTAILLSSGISADAFRLRAGNSAPAAAAGDDALLWDATNDKILWDATGDAILWE